MSGQYGFGLIRFDWWLGNINKQPCNCHRIPFQMLIVLIGALMYVMSPDLQRSRTYVKVVTGAQTKTQKQKSLMWNNWNRKCVFWHLKYKKHETVLRVVQKCPIVALVILTSKKMRLSSRHIAASLPTSSLHLVGITGWCGPCSFCIC